MIPACHELLVVTPVFEDAEASSRLFRELRASFGDDLFIVAVDDGSVREVLDTPNLAEAGVEGVVLRLRRNVGHQRAICVGLGFVAEHMQPHQRVVVMDSDGEDLPASIPVLLGALDPTTTDVVVAQRKNRVETLHFKAFYAIYKRFFALMTGRRISFGNFMALSPKAVRRLVAMPELSIHVAGTVLASRLRIRMLLLDRGPRYAGKSKMNFLGLALHGFKALMVFAEDVLVRVGIACCVIAVLSFLSAALAILLKTIGFATPGWFSIALGILVLIFLQTGTLALMSLLLTGVVRSGAIARPLSYRDLVEEVHATQSREPAVSPAPSHA